MRDKKITCYVIKTDSASVINYSNVRTKNIESKFSKSPEVDDLIPIFSVLKKEVGAEKALTAINRYASSLGFPDKDKDAIKKFTSWPDEQLNILISILVKYRAFQTNDSKLNDKGITNKLKFGNKLPLTKCLFRQLSKVDPSHLECHHQAIIKKEVSRRELSVEGEKESYLPASDFSTRLFKTES